MAMFEYPLKLRLKNFLLSPAAAVKPGDVLSVAIKAFLVVCSFVSVGFCFYFVFSGCPDCHRFSDLRRPSTAITVAVAPSSSYADDAPAPYQSDPTDVSHLLFGIGGSAQTWGVRRRYSELWWRPNSTRGFVWLDVAPPSNMTWPSTTPPYRISADTSSFNYTCWYGSRSAIRMARIVKESFELGLPNVRWFVMGDDDTVFFLDNLITVLNKYDHNQMYYVGGISESVEQDVIHSYTMAYGGGGFAISYPLAAVLVRLLDGCINRYASFYGSDQKIQGCLSEIGVHLTLEPGFHQVDIRGNPYGLLAAHPAAPLVSLHHLDYVDPIFPATSRIESLKKLMSAYKSDPNRALQHTFCHDPTRKWSVSVSWGYTVQLYPSLVNAKELAKAFRTFKSWRTWSDEPFTFDTRPVSDDPCRRPVIYFLDRVYESGSGRRSMTTYRKHVDVNDPVCDSPEYSRAMSVEVFNVSATKLKSDVWKRAPRRQCCKVINGGDKALRVKIRDCKPFESVTPP